jgi:hypothetical protein
MYEFLRAFLIVLVYGFILTEVIEYLLEFI